VAGKKKVVKKKIVAKASVSVVKKFTAAFYSSLKVIPSDFADKVCELQAEMKMPVVLLWHGSSNDPMSFLEDLNYTAFAKNIHKLDESKKVVVLIHSPGGSAGPAFKLASLLRKHCGGFDVVVPSRAKSAATLFSLGADEIIMSKFAELGPLDVQISDSEKEMRFSALEVVQAIERLNSEAI